MKSEEVLDEIVSSNILLSTLVVFIVSASVRMFFFTGFFGSDDFTYFNAANAIVDGNLEVGNYIGGIRYGVNLPMAALMKVFGTSEFSSNLWSLISSSLEVSIIYYMAACWWGRRAAVSAAILLMLLPIHVHFGGRIMADAPLALFITTSFIMFRIATYRFNSNLYFLTGCALGTIFWVKAIVAVLVHLAFIPNIIRMMRNTPKNIFIMALGSGLLVGGNCLFFWYFQGDPFHLVRSVLAATSKYGYLSFEDSPLYYPLYLFVKLYHTWLLGYLFAFSLIVYFFRKERDANFNYVVLWCLSLIIVFTFFVLPSGGLIAKQVNYMLIFVAPMTLVSGYFLSKINRRIYFFVMMIYVSGSLVLSYLEQINIRSFTANARSIASYSSLNPGMKIFSSTLPYRFSSNLPKYDKEIDFSNVEYLDKKVVMSAMDNGESFYVAIDPVSFSWSREDFTIDEIKSLSVLVESHSASSEVRSIAKFSNFMDQSDNEFFRRIGDFITNRFIPQSWGLYRISTGDEN
ncbi:ArnT family glycosyltransferase [Marinobacterium aestuarii]|uniref:ArnT family glycosyltransferase n=1 Tax=Marinobacterium aestuarii TaxID=1821621 RepID=UPI000A61665B|nr:glycosyltransferase family 39 protein [Marinobacterium aestuarii]